MLVVDDMGEALPDQIATTVQQAHNQLGSALRENDQLRTKLDYVTYELIPSIIGQAMTQNIHIGGNFQGNLLGTAGGGDIQMTYNAHDLDQIGTLVATILDHCARLELPADWQRDLEAKLTTIQTQRTASQPNPTIIRESLRSVRTILESGTGGAIGNLVATWLPVLNQWL